MYKPVRKKATTLKENKSYHGESLEKKIKRILENKEPITDTAPLIYTERKDGVNPDMDIRSDRWEYAVEAMDKVTKSHRAKRAHSLGERAKKGMEQEDKTNKDVGGPESTQGTENQ